VGASDFNRMRPSFGAAAGDPLYDPALDSQGDGRVGSADWNLLRSETGSQQPGPSGLACAGAPEAMSGAVPCAAP
jgi:hypothetical protein